MTSMLMLLVDICPVFVEAFVEASPRQVEVVTTSTEALGAHRGAAVLAVCEIGPETPHGVELFRLLRRSLPGCPIVVLARAIPIDAVVDLMRDGAADVIGLPADPAGVAVRAVARARPLESTGFIGGSAPTQRLRTEIRALAGIRSTVLLTGETGVGKGLAARLIHDLSPWGTRPFVQVDCATLAPSLVESELFGHERGAFTGAHHARPGRFELAGDGTIFLDEVGELERPLQAKLLRVLQDREFERLGGTQTHFMPARVIAATNQDLRAHVAAGRFRADLYFRLSVYPIHIAPLRERAGDVPLLVRTLLGRIAERLQVPAPQLPEELFERLCGHAWPGNVRELVNALERIVIRESVGLPDVEEWEDRASACEPRPFMASLAEGHVIEHTLRLCGGNVARTARRLGIARSTLRYKISRHDLDHLLPRD